MDRMGNVILIIGFIGGFSQWLTDHEPSIQATFYILSMLVLIVGFGLKMYDRFKK